ncbi:E1 ubiquitin-activating protein aos1 [Emydomyces testavorans]|uniref:E1 ubiquitin-activating protein aos1 n=1 Tax=Emydomyces testavorans TaxID=2070801 RepID=A0AAF0DF08_9EURO|nr:E1 ubiquitin-activating protein aos1 [Emydomyces testavorans]
MPSLQVMAQPEGISNSISADEIALYDRQIRLWGVKAQEKIRTAKILLISLKAIGNEIAKNLVLAGIGSLTILDDGIAREEDLGAQFFISEDSIGQSVWDIPVDRFSRWTKANSFQRAEAAAPQIRQMNPRVQLHVDTSDVKMKPAEYFAAFDIIIATDLDFDTFSTINAACRVTNRPSYMAGLHGFYGFIFADLISHDFVIQREKSNIASRTHETKTRTILHVTTKIENEKVIELVTKREIYTPLVLANTSSLPEEFTKSIRKRRQVTPLLTCLRALWEFQRQNGGAYPSFSRADLEQFTALANARHAELKLDPSTLTAEFLRSFLQNVGSEINPVAAFLGGNLAQDAINVLSAREQPLQNFLLFDGERNLSPIYSLHPLTDATNNGP